MRANGLHTVCEEAGCPNIGECWEKKHATFMIMGDTCTRACAFCNVKTGLPGALDAEEPAHVAEATAKLGLAHVVVTSVDRDDLDDGGAAHFAATIRAIRARCPATTIEVLTPDFLRKDGAVETVVAARPDVFNHNLETVPSKYLTVRPGARYFASIRLLQRVKEIDPTMFTKSGIMVGLGEERNEVMQVMDDLRAADVDFLTIGQYLQPTRKHHEVVRFVPPDEFKAYETIAYAKGFLMVSASPLTRSSHHAGEDFARLKAARARTSALSDAAVLQQAPGPARRRRDVRSCRRRRALSGIRAAVPRAQGAAADPGAGRRRDPRRGHDGRLQARARDALPAASRSTGRICRSWSNISKARSAIWRTAGPSTRSASSVCEVEFFISYEFTQPDARPADGLDVRRRLPPLRARLRAARRPHLSRVSGA